MSNQKEKQPPEKKIVRGKDGYAGGRGTEKHGR